MVAASEQIETDQLENFVMVGELALNGAVRPVKGVLPIALRAREEGKTGLLVPPENAAEAAVGDVHLTDRRVEDEEVGRQASSGRVGPES